jgi:hypothetical protein
MGGAVKALADLRIPVLQSPRTLEAASWRKSARYRVAIQRKLPGRAVFLQVHCGSVTTPSIRCRSDSGWTSTLGPPHHRATMDAERASGVGERSALCTSSEPVSTPRPARNSAYAAYRTVTPFFNSSTSRTCMTRFCKPNAQRWAVLGRNCAYDRVAAPALVVVNASRGPGHLLRPPVLQLSAFEKGQVLALAQSETLLEAARGSDAGLPFQPTCWPADLERAHA